MGESRNQLAENEVPAEHWKPLQEALGAGDTDGRKFSDLIAPMYDRLVTTIRKCIDANLQARVSASSAVQSALIALNNEEPDELGKKVKDADSLMSWLVAVAMNKMRDRVRRELAQKRGGSNGATSLDAEGVDPIALISRLPDPAVRAEMQELYERCMEAVRDDPDLRKITVAEMFLNGCSDSEIAQKLEMSPSWVRKARNTILCTWQEIANEGNNHAGL